MFKINTFLLIEQTYFGSLNVSCVCLSVMSSTNCRKSNVFQYQDLQHTNVHVQSLLNTLYGESLANAQCHVIHVYTVQCIQSS